MFELKIDGINIKDVWMVQNGWGQFMLKNGTKEEYPYVTMKEFPSALLNPPKGYSFHSGGSHSETAWRLAQKAIDLAVLGWSTANEDYKVTEVYVAGDLSHVRGRFTNFGEVWFVHCGNPALVAGSIVKAGKPIVKSVFNHYHIFSSEFDFYKKYMDQNKTVDMPENVYPGTLLTTLVPNIAFRSSPRLSGKVIRYLKQGEILTVRNDHFTINGGYAWVDVRIGNDKGCVAWQDSWYSTKTVTCEDKLAHMQTELNKANEQIALLTDENKALKFENKSLKDAINSAKPKIESALKDLNVA